MKVYTSQFKHVISVDQMDATWIETLFTCANNIKTAHTFGNNSPEWSEFSKSMQNKVMVALFYEPSTRTRLSFESAMLKLGGNVIGTEAARMFSSATKGETLEDTINVCAKYGDVIVLRHDDKGSADQAAKLDICPIINAGDGDGEHPTQALLDLFTIWSYFQNQNDKILTVVGDLKHGRTVHSLVKLAASLTNSNLHIINKINLVAPEGFNLPEKYKQTIEQSGISYTSSNTLTNSLVAESDTIYMTRAQKERAKGEQISGEAYALSESLAKNLKNDAMILHPLPRNDEIPTALDTMPQAKYFEQAENGLYIRMALLLQQIS